jgi:hypothetical protein
VVGVSDVNDDAGAYVYGAVRAFFEKLTACPKRLLGLAS